MQGKWVLSVAGNMQIPHAAGQLSQQHSERSPHTPQWRLSAGKKKKTRKNKNKTGLEQYRCMFLFYKKVRILLLVDDTFIITSQKLL